jgi:hypothetical protein
MTEVTEMTAHGADNNKKVRPSSKQQPTPPSPVIQQYALQPIPVSEIRYIRRHTPTLGWHYIVIVLKEKGVSLPPLFFHLGGVRKFLSVLKEHVALMRSEHDKNCYVVNEISEPIKRTLAPVQDQMDDQMLRGVFAAQNSGGGEGEGFKKDGGGGDDEDSQRVAAATHPPHPHLDSAGSQMSSVLLDKAFHLTRKAYDTTSYFLQDWKETFSDNHFQNCLEGRQAHDTEDSEGDGEGQRRRKNDEEEVGIGDYSQQSDLTPLDNKTLNTLQEKLQMTLQDGVDFLST